MSQMESTPLAPALWRQLSLAAQGLQSVLAGQSARAILQEWPQNLRPGAQALLYQTLRHLGTAQALRKQLAPRKSPAFVDALMCTSLAVLLDAKGLGYDEFTLVNQAVTVLRKNHKKQAQAGFVNACLRRFLRERDVLLAAIAQDEIAQWNHPQWWIDLLKQQYPDQWQAILQANNSRAPLTLRVNTTQISRQAYAKELESNGIAHWPVEDAGLILEKAYDVRRLPGYAQGWFSVQDAGAQKAAALLLDGLVQKAAPGEKTLRVLDACAAPGGKSAHLLEYAARHLCKIDLLALDVDAKRCERIHENLERLALHSRVATADAALPQSWPADVMGDGQFDAILLDAPCSASGIVRRHADVRWLRRESDIEALAVIQQQLLMALWPLLRSGGHLLYCTCSVFHNEGKAQIDQFLQNQSDAKLLAPVQHLLPHTISLPTAARAPIDHDGFFYALLQKQPLLQE